MIFGLVVSALRFLNCLFGPEQVRSGAGCIDNLSLRCLSFCFLFFSHTAVY